MMDVFGDMARTIVPARGDRHGPLPPLLIVLTIVTGLVDAVSYLSLGHVFVANMTGNVVFLGFAMAGASDLSAAASLVALVAFMAGALLGGRVGTRFDQHRGRRLTLALQQFSIWPNFATAGFLSQSNGARRSNSDSCRQPSGFEDSDTLS